MNNYKILDVEVFVTAPNNIDLVVVRIKTNKTGLYGLGCATFTQRAIAVKHAIEDYLKSFLIGKDPSNIEDIWNSANVSGYWRNGPIMNNALSGIDMALWDIKGKIADLPVYELLGGKSRDGVALYRHTDGSSKEEVVEDIRQAIKEGYQHVRCQLGMYGGAGTEDTGLISKKMEAAKGLVKKRSPDNLREGQYFDTDGYLKSVVELLSYIRTEVGENIELIHDIHERVSPIDAIKLAKKVEKFNLFYLEDPFPPENLEWLKMLREQTSTPIAIGELFSHPNDWKQLIISQQIDFIRAHISAIGGITPARKLAVLGEIFGVRTAWHGPGDISPIGVAANLHLDISVSNFGIQEWTPMNQQLREVFPGGPIIKEGYAYLTDAPGLGVDFCEKAALAHPPRNEPPEWTLARTYDGTSVKP
ncbi:starvation-sensing protein RspA [Salipaludibacillus neizhouensis]|uniref:Starvation-sensing protein RspA n=1 Tax=Salipaludibacillus neizhouensis TaxID=885475 RepID=A0A3A9K069_9BACI|nr:enolase C-terminal domain-like protein [Salipaludibacillus neizhouensis]RKL66494.1 starvation-sensing protein RspA [Salipaludibacillus neizhouensis]